MTQEQYQQMMQNQGDYGQEGNNEFGLDGNQEYEELDGQNQYYRTREDPIQEKI